MQIGLYSDTWKLSIKKPLEWKLFELKGITV